LKVAAVSQTIDVACKATPKAKDVKDSKTPVDYDTTNVMGPSPKRQSQQSHVLASTPSFRTEGARD
jgi:hypothetical protein